MNKDILITTITPDDWKVLRDIKLNSLEQEPIAFEEAEEGGKKYIERTEKEWRARLDPERNDRFLLFAKDIDTGTYIGTAFVSIEKGIGTIQHVFVDKDYRGHGIGLMLLTEMIARLRKRSDVTSAEI